MAYDTVFFTALLHDLGSLRRRAEPHSPESAAVDHAALGRQLFEAHFAPRLTRLFDAPALAEIASGIAEHHIDGSLVGQADALASGTAVADPADEQPADPSRQALLCPVSRDIAAPAGHAPWTVPPRTPDLHESQMPVRPAADHDFAEQYRRLHQLLIEGVATLPAGSTAAFGESLVALLERTTAAVPTSRAAREPFVSLFDHSVWTAALAGALQAIAASGPAAGGEFRLFGLRLDRGIGGNPLSPGRGIYDGLVMRLLGRRLRDALGLTAASVLFRGEREVVLLGGNTYAVLREWETAMAALRAAAIERFGQDRTLQFATVAVERSAPSGIAAIVRRLSEAWDQAGRRPMADLWADPAAWGPVAKPPALPAMQSEAISAAARETATLTIRPAGQQGTDAPRSPTAEAVVPVRALGTEIALEPAGTAPGAGDSAHILLVHPRLREWPAPAGDPASDSAARTWELAPAFGDRAPAEAHAGHGVFVVALDQSDADLGGAGDPPAAFTTLARRLDLFFSGLLPARIADRGGSILAADRHWTAAAAAAHSALDLLALAQAEFSQYSGGRADATLSAAFVPADGRAPEARLESGLAGASAARAAGGGRVWFGGELLIWSEYLDFRRLADDLLAGPVRERRLRAGFLGELSRGRRRTGDTDDIGRPIRRLPPRLLSSLTRATHDPGLLGALNRQLGKAGGRLPLLARMAELVLGW